MNAVLIDRNLGYPNSFYQRLNDLNAEKLPFSPVALVLKASTREACLADLPRIIRMAKTHRVVLQELNQNRSIGKNIQEAFEKTGMRPKKLVCFSHAIDPSRIEIGRHQIDPREDVEWRCFYSSEDVKKEDFFNLDENAQIFLSGCRTGFGKSSLARRIADVSGRTVFAPEGFLNRAATCFLEYPDGQWKMLSYLPEEEIQHVYKFTPDGSFKISSKKSLENALESREEIRCCFASYAQLMERYALRGNAQARREMAVFCSMAIP